MAWTSSRLCRHSKHSSGVPGGSSLELARSMERIAAEQQRECQCNGQLFLGLHAATTGSVTEDCLLLLQNPFCHGHLAQEFCGHRAHADASLLEVPPYTTDAANRQLFFMCLLPPWSGPAER